MTWLKPTKTKYVDEAVGVYFQFGVHADGRVDVATVHGDVFVGLTKYDAARVVEAQAEFREKLYAILCEAE